jgi:hypothetical protein
MRGCPAPEAWSTLHEVGVRFLSLRSSWRASLPDCPTPVPLYRPAASFPELDVEIWEAVPAQPRSAPPG